MLLLGERAARYQALCPRHLPQAPSKPTTLPRKRWASCSATPALSAPFAAISGWLLTVVRRERLRLARKVGLVAEIPLKRN